MPEIIKQRRVVEDDWATLHLTASDAPETIALPKNHFLAPLSVWLKRKDELLHRHQETGQPLGVWLAPNEEPENIAADLDHLDLIGVHFPKFTDGRGYSTARLLCERYHFAGELRAFGDIGQDQLFYLARVGFNSFALRETGADLIAALDALESFPDVYQAAVIEPQPLFRRRAT